MLNLKNKIERLKLDSKIKHEIDKLQYDIKEINNRNNSIVGFIKANRPYEQSKEIIDTWKKENNIKYNPKEAYSRGQGFYSAIGAYSTVELDLLLQNLLQHI